MWNQRYSDAEYLFGKEPNEYLVEMSGHIPAGRVLCLAEGEGRNAVYLAQQGYLVTGVDSSEIGLGKAQQLAAERSVKLTTIVADLATFVIEPGVWSGIISIFCHLPHDLRAAVHKRVVDGLKPGGVFIMESYTPRQLEFKTGGPSTADVLPNAERLKNELVGLRFERLVELERNVIEGQGHSGHAAVVQVLGVKP